MTTKIYRTTYLTTLTIKLIVNGKSIFADFKNGSYSVTFKPATFVTSDAAVQKAIEAHPMFGKDFELWKANKTANTEAPKPPAQKLPDAPPSIELVPDEEVNFDLPGDETFDATLPNDEEPIDATEPEAEELDDESDDTTVEEEQPTGQPADNTYPDVTNAQQARMVLASVLGANAVEGVIKADDIRILATEKGIEFPNWKPRN